MTPQEIDELVLVTERNHAALVRLVRELQRENAELREATEKLIDHVCGDMGVTEDNPYIQAARDAIEK